MKVLAGFVGAFAFLAAGVGLWIVWHSLEHGLFLRGAWAIAAFVFLISCFNGWLARGLWRAHLVPMLALVLMLCPALLDAGNRCTSGVTGVACASVHGSVQATLDAAINNDQVYVAGAWVEDVVQTTRNTVIGQPGNSITGATPGGVTWHSQGVPQVHHLRGLNLIAAMGGTALKASGGYHLYFYGQGSVTCPAGGMGVLFEGGDQHDVRYTTVMGCDVGYRAVHVPGAYVTRSRFLNNGVGVQIEHGQTGGQYFFNTFEDNGVAIETRALFNNDINSNDIVCPLGGIGYRSALASTPNPTSGSTTDDYMELGYNEFDGCAGQHYAIQRCDGSWTNDPMFSPQSRVQYGSNDADGVPLPTITTPIGPGC